MKWNRLSIACCCSLIVSIPVFGQTLEQAVALTLKITQISKAHLMNLRAEGTSMRRQQAPICLLSILMRALVTKA